MVVAALALDSCLSITSLGTLFTCTKQQQQQQTNMSIKNNIILFILINLKLSYLCLVRFGHPAYMCPQYKNDIEKNNHEKNNIEK